MSKREVNNKLKHSPPHTAVLTVTRRDDLIKDQHSATQYVRFVPRAGIASFTRSPRRHGRAERAE